MGRELPESRAWVVAIVWLTGAVVALIGATVDTTGAEGVGYGFPPVERVAVDLHQDGVTATDP